MRRTERSTTGSSVVALAREEDPEARRDRHAVEADEAAADVRAEVGRGVDVPGDADRAVAPRPVPEVLALADLADEVREMDDRHAEADARLEQLVGDADDVPVAREHRTAGVARGEHGVRLDERVALRADDALRHAEVEQPLELAREAREVAVRIADREDRRADRDVRARDERRGVGGSASSRIARSCSSSHATTSAVVCLPPGNSTRTSRPRSTTCSAVATCLFERKTKPVPRPPSGRVMRTTLGFVAL